MSHADHLNDAFQYAKLYSELPYGELKGLELLHVSKLIKEYTKKGYTAIDYGCGPGYSTLYLKSFSLCAEGVDVNPHMIQIAQQKDPSGKYQVITSGEIPAKDGYYDFVYSSWVLLHAATKNELLKICQDIFRVLKKGGTFIMLTNSNYTYDNKEWLVLDTRFEENKNLTSGSIAKALFKNKLVVYAYYWTEEDYREALTKARLTVERIVKPLGTDSDGFAWISEKEAPYVALYVAKKV